MSCSPCVVGPGGMSARVGDERQRGFRRGLFELSPQDGEGSWASADWTARLGTTPNEMAPIPACTNCPAPFLHTPWVVVAQMKLGRPPPIPAPTSSSGQYASNIPSNVPIPFCNSTTVLLLDSRGRSDRRAGSVCCALVVMINVSIASFRIKSGNLVLGAPYPRPFGLPDGLTSACRPASSRSSGDGVSSTSNPPVRLDNPMRSIRSVNVGVEGGVPVSLGGLESGELKREAARSLLRRMRRTLVEGSWAR